MFIIAFYLLEEVQRRENQGTSNFATYVWKFHEKMLTSDDKLTNEKQKCIASFLSG